MINFQGTSFTQEERRWIYEWIDSKCSPKTKEAYSETIQQLIDSLPENYSLNNTYLSHLQGFLKQKSHQSPYTQKRHKSALQSLYSFLTDHGYVEKNLGRGLKKITTPHTISKKYLTQEEVIRIFLSEKNERNRILLKLMYVLGLRISEVTQLKWKDIQNREDHGLVNISGKGGKSRSIPISGSLWDELKKFRGTKKDFEPLFTAWNDGENPLSPDQIQQIIKKAALRAGITKPVSPHWLRHAHASHAIDRGAPIHLVQTTLGHASVATTGKYLHARPNESSGKYLSV